MRNIFTYLYINCLYSAITDKLLDGTGAAIIEEFQNSNAKQLRYKITLASAFFFKFYKKLCKILKVR